MQEPLNLGIDVHVLDMGGYEWMAAIKFSEHSDEEASSWLRKSIKLQPGNIAAWNMLFDLYRITDDQAEFEMLSMEYLDVFGLTPPPWSPIIASSPAPAEHEDAKDSLVSIQSINQDAAALLSIIAKRVIQDGGRIVLDFGVISRMDKAGISATNKVLLELFSKKVDVGMINHEKFLPSMLATCKKSGDNATDAWLLLMNFYRIADMQEAFDDAAVAYCEVSGMSPPAWQPLTTGKPVAEVSPGVVKTSAVPDGWLVHEIKASNGLALLPDNEVSSLEKLLKADREKVAISFANAVRIDFQTASKIASIKNIVTALSTGRAGVFNANHMLKSVISASGIGQKVI